MRFPERRQIYNAEWAEILKASLIFLWDGRMESRDIYKNQIFICFAIKMSVGPNDESILQLVEEIDTRLGDYVYFNRWYSVNVNTCPTSEELQQARLDWMKDMIEEFSCQ